METSKNLKSHKKNDSHNLSSEQNGIPNKLSVKKDTPSMKHLFTPTKDKKAKLSNHKTSVLNYEMKNQDRKRQATLDFKEEPNTKSNKLPKYDTFELMNKLEEFSDVWNDFPTVQNPKPNSNHWFGHDNYNAIEKQNKSVIIKNDTAKKNYKSYSDIANEEVKRSDREGSAKFQNEHIKVKQFTRHIKNNVEKLEMDNSLQEGNNQSEKYDSKLADLKRQKAVQEQRQLHADQKNIIKQALSSLDGKQKVNKKIVFSDTGETDKVEHNKLEESKPKKHHNLFDDDYNNDSESDVNFKLNHQFQGIKGQKLLELQSKFANDSRFNLDTRFYESGSGESENETTENTSHSDEKQKQLAILESIVNRQIKPLSEIKKNSSKKIKDTFLLRFDPTREDHNKYIVKPQEPTKDERKKEKKKKSKKGEKEITTNVQENKTQVSNETFYSVTEDLKQVLKKDSGTEFSLLKLFGSKETEDSQATQEQTENIKKLKHSVKNPFKYDSSESEAEDETEKVVEKQDKNVRKQTAASWKTTFFFTENDTRLQEAMEFLKGPEEIEDDQEYAEKRKLLKNFIRHKFKNNTRKKGPFKKKLGGLKKKVFLKKKARRS